MNALLSDLPVLIAVHAIFALLVMGAVLRNFALRRDRGDFIEVRRGRESLSFLYVFYGITTVMFGLMLELSDAAQGYKVAIITVDYVVLTYLCFFNTWFRNKLIGIYLKLQQD